MSEIRVKVADLAVAPPPAVLVTIGLGSCVAITLHDAVARLGGLAHVLLPSEGMSRDRSNRAKFAGSAVPFMIEQLCARGAIKSRLRAKLAGGAAMFASLQPAPALQMGERNIQAARAALERAGIPILAQDVGGDFGRSIFFNVEDGVMLIKSVRRGDISV